MASSRDPSDGPPDDATGQTASGLTPNSSDKQPKTPPPKSPSAGEATDDSPPPYDDEDAPQQSPRMPFPMFLFVVALLALGALYLTRSTKRGDEIAYNVFHRELADGNVEKVTIKGQVIIGEFKSPRRESLTDAQFARLDELQKRQGEDEEDDPSDGTDAATGETADSSDDGDSAESDGEPAGGDGPLSPEDRKILDLAKEARYFHTIVPVYEDAQLVRELLEKAGKVESEEAPSVNGFSIFINTLFVIVLIWFLLTILRRSSDPMSSGMFGNFVRSPAKRFSPDQKQATFDDVAGMEYPKEELAEVVEFLRSPAKFQRLGAEIPKGVLLSGPPGTGKTLLARATAGEAGRAFFSINGSEFIQMFVGVGASRVRDMFQTAKKHAPCILFIDEIDAVGRVRGAGVGGGHDEREQTLNQILSEMDGFEPSTSVIVIGATNRPDVLDPALLRPGRFDRKIEVDLPSKDGRLGILKVHARKVPLGDGVDLERWAAATIGFSGAELRNLVNESALHAVREGHDEVQPEDFEQAFDKIILGGPRAEKYSEREKKMTAYHEAGHALVAWFVPDVDPVHKVTIVPRGRTGGVTQFRPVEERVADSERRLHGRLAVAMGGRVAEDIVFGEVTTGARGDLMQATRIARAMVGKFGMSEQVGPVAFDQSDEHPFLGREMHESSRKFSDETAHLMDTEVQRFLSKADERARQICNEHRDKLDAIADILLSKEIVTDDDLEEIIGPPVERRHRIAVPSKNGDAASHEEPAAT